MSLSHLGMSLSESRDIEKRVGQRKKRKNHRRLWWWRWWWVEANHGVWKIFVRVLEERERKVWECFGRVGSGFVFELGLWLRWVCALVCSTILGFWIPSFLFVFFCVICVFKFEFVFGSGFVFVFFVFLFLILFLIFLFS